jgi:uncharacterized protein YgiM (DUF1202 family)
MTTEPQPAVAEITAEAQTAAALDLPDLSTPYAGQPAFIYARHVVNVRSGPGTGYLVITTLQPDTAVSVISSDDLNEWLQIEMANGMTGWIAAYLLTLEPSSAEIVNVSLRHSPVCNSAVINPVMPATHPVSRLQAILAAKDPMAAARLAVVAITDRVQAGAIVPDRVTHFS